MSSTEQPNSDQAKRYLVEQLSSVIQRPPLRNMEREVHIVVHRPGNVGGTPTVPAIGATMGFDWDNRKLLIFTEKPLTELTPEQVEAVNESVKKGQSWHAFEAYKKHRNEMIILEASKLTLATCLIELLSSDTLNPEQKNRIEQALSEANVNKPRTA